MNTILRVDPQRTWIKINDHKTFRSLNVPKPALSVAQSPVYFDDAFPEDSVVHALLERTVSARCVAVI